MKQYIPRNFDVDAHLEAHPPVGIKNFHKDYIIYILNLLTEIPARRDSHESDDGYVPLNAVRLRKRIRNYMQYINYLVETEVLICDNYYIKGEKSRGYKFNSAYYTKIKPVKISKYTLVRSIQADNHRKREVPKKYQYLVDSLADLSLSPHAIEFLESFYTADLMDEKRFKSYSTTLRNLDWISTGDFYYSIDNTINRLHTNLTSLNSDFRRFLSYKDTPLVAVDITNCQPYLSIALLNPDFYNPESKFNLYQLNTSLNNNNIHMPYTSSSPLPYPFHSTSPNPTQPPLPPPMLYKMLEEKDRQDVKHYVELVEKGLIYEFLAEEIYESLGFDLRGNRKNTKKVVFTVLFTANQFIGQIEAGPKRVFKQHFPTVYEIFSIIKKRDGSRLSILLQNMESFLVLDKICPRIRRERADLPIYTIHDCVVTTIGNEDYIKQVMEEELSSAIGHKPTLKIEYWTISSNT